VKNKAYPDTLYVTELVAPNTVNTMPEATLRAFADHGELHGDAVSGTEDAAREVFAGLAHVGVDMDDVFLTLENEGVQKFDDSWQELTATVSDQLARRSPEQS
jgi:transaldolase